MTGLTLHQALDYSRLAGLVLCFGSITGATLTAAIRARKNVRKHSMHMAARLIATPGRFAIHGLLWLVAKPNLKSNITPIQTKHGDTAA